MRHVSYLLLLLVVSVGAPALGGDDPFNLSSYNTGIAVGCVVDAETKAPLAGASVTLEMPGAGDQYAAPVTTDEKGCYRLPVPMGVSKSKVSAKKLLKSSLFSLATNPKGVTEQTKAIYNSFASIKVEKAGYKSFTGLNEALFGDPMPFEIYMDGLLMAPESAEYASYLTSDGGGDGFEIVSADLPFYFAADADTNAEVKLKLPAAVSPALTVDIVFADFFNKPFEGDKYKFTLPLAGVDTDGTRTYSGKIVARRKNFPREFRIIASINSGEKRLAEKSYPSVMPSSQQEIEAAKSYAEGMRQMEAGNFAEAETALRQAITLDKSTKCYYEQLVAALQKQDKFDEAQAALRDWVAMDPKGHVPYVEGAKLYVSKHMYEDALKAMPPAKKFDKNNPDYRRYYEPLVSIHRIEFEKPAQADFERAITMLVNHTDDAEYTSKLLEKADQLFPNDATISYLYANALYNSGKMQDAITRYERAVSFNAKNDEYKIALAKAYIDQDQCDKALNLLEPVARDSKQFYIHHLAGVCQLKTGQRERGVQSLAEAVKFGLSKELMAMKGNEYISTPYSHYEGDTYTYGTFVFRQEQTRRMYSGFSYDEGKYDFGFLAADDALTAVPDKPAAMLQSGAMLYNLGLYAAAIDNLKQAADAGLPQAHKLLAICYKATGDSDSAAKSAEAYRQLNPFDKDESLP